MGGNIEIRHTEAHFESACYSGWEVGQMAGLFELGDYLPVSIETGDFLNIWISLNCSRRQNSLLLSWLLCYIVSVLNKEGIATDLWPTVFANNKKQVWVV